MRTIRCRNCGISYQETATICLRCMSPLEKSIIKISNKSEVEMTTNVDSKALTSDTNLSSPKAVHQRDKSLPIQHAVRPKNIGHHTVSDVGQSKIEHEPSSSEPSQENAREILSELETISESKVTEQQSITDQQLKKESVNSSENMSPTPVSEPESMPDSIKSESVSVTEGETSQDQSQSVQHVIESQPLEENTLESLVNLSSEHEPLPSQPIPTQQQYPEQPIEEETIDDSEKILSEMEELLGERKSNNGNELQIYLNHLKNDYNINVISKTDFFYENGYFLTNGSISHLNLGGFKNKDVITKFLTNEVNSLQNLKMLDLRENNLTPDDIEPVFQLKSLKSLNISKNNIDHLSDEIANLENLEGLYVSDLPINTLPDLSALKNLKEINLSHSSIQALPKSLLSLSNFRTLNVFSTQITPDNEIIEHLRESGIFIII